MAGSVYISAGEISGDQHGAELIRHLKATGDMDVYGLGGPQMQSAGMHPAFSDVSTLNTVGYVESFRFIGKKWRSLRASLNLIREKNIQNIILVDNQGFNLILAEKAKKNGLRVFYYIPPRVSLWGAWNASKVAKQCDYILPFLTSDVPIYKRYTDHVFYSGNPVADKIAAFHKDKDFTSSLKTLSGRLLKKPKLAGFFPGSRHQELRTLLPVFVRVASSLITEGYTPVFSAAHSDFEKTIRIALERKGMANDSVLLNGSALDIMAESPVNIMASGTATLESALLGSVPLIAYKVSAITYMIGKRLVTKQMIGLPNILLDKLVFPELLQGNMHPARILTEFHRIENSIEQYRPAFENLKKTIGPSGASQRAAEYIKEHMQ